MKESSKNEAGNSDGLGLGAADDDGGGGVLGVLGGPWSAGAGVFGGLGGGLYGGLGSRLLAVVLRMAWAAVALVAVWVPRGPLEVLLVQDPVDAVADGVALGAGVRLSHEVAVLAYVDARVARIVDNICFKKHRFFY